MLWLVEIYFFLFEIIIISDFCGLKSISQFMAQVLSVSKSVLILFSKYAVFLNFCRRVTSSAKSEMSQFILSSMSFMYIRKSNGDKPPPRQIEHRFCKARHSDSVIKPDNYHYIECGAFNHCSDIRVG